MLLSLLSFASADADMMVAPCMGPMVTATLPEAGATDVPVDALPAFIWQEDCGESGSFVGQLWLGEDLLFEETFLTDGPAQVGVERMMLVEVLEPNTEYLLRLSGPEGDQDIAFTTGEHQVAGAAEPEIADVRTSVSRYRWTFWAYTDITVVAGEDPDAMSVLMLLNEDGTLVSASTQPNPVLDDYVAGDIGDLPEEICHTLIQEDALGAQSEPIESCWTPEDPGLMEGCSSAPASGSLLAGLLGLLLAARRRVTADSGSA